MQRRRSTSRARSRCSAGASGSFNAEYRAPRARAPAARRRRPRTRSRSPSRPSRACSASPPTWRCWCSRSRRLLRGARGVARAGGDRRRLRRAGAAHLALRRVPGGPGDLDAARARHGARRSRVAARALDEEDAAARSTATASEPVVVARTRAVSRFPRPVERAAAALALAVAVLVWALTRTYPNYDSYYHLVWGRRAARRARRRPSRPTRRRPSTRSTSRSARVLGLVFGESADRVLVLVCLLSHAALVFGDLPARRGGLRALERRAGGAVRGRERVVPALRRARVRRRAVPRAGGLGGRAARPRAATAAAAGAARRSRACCGPRRGCSPASGGLVRAARRRVACGSRVALVAAPLLWALDRPVVTGDPLHSLHATSELADDLGRVRGLQHVPGLVRLVRRRDRPPAGGAARAGRRRARVALPRLARAARCRWRCSRRA